MESIGNGGRSTKIRTQDIRKNHVAAIARRFVIGQWPFYIYIF